MGTLVSRIASSQVFPTIFVSPLFCSMPSKIVSLRPQSAGHGAGEKADYSIFYAKGCHPRCKEREERLPVLMSALKDAVSHSYPKLDAGEREDFQHLYWLGRTHFIICGV